MKSSRMTTILLLAGCGWGLWKMTSGWFGPAVEPGKVTLLTESNFYEVRRDSGMLVALYMQPG
jgi:hypothetical protein